MKLYLIISAIIFFVLGISWKKSDFLNFFVKVVLICMGIIGFLYWLIAEGYVLKH